MAALRPVWASLTTSFTPSRPRAFSEPQEVRPERLGFRGSDPQADDLPAALGIGGNGDYGRDRYDPPALALLEVGGVEPDVGPVAGQGSVQELANPFVDILAQLRDGALGDAAQPHSLHQIVDLAGRDAADPSLLNYGDERLLRGLAGLKEARKVAALTQLRHPQVQRAEARVERAVAVAISPGRAPVSPFVPPGTDQAVDIGLHHQLKDSLSNAAQKISLIVLGQKLGQVHVGFGHRGLRVVRG